MSIVNISISFGMCSLQASPSFLGLRHKTVKGLSQSRLARSVQGLLIISARAFADLLPVNIAQSLKLLAEKEALVLTVIHHQLTSPFHPFHFAD